MSISLVSFASALGNSVAIPNHQARDAIIIFGGRNNTTPPTIPSGWVQLAATGANNASAVAAFKIAKAPNETSGVFTNASVLQVIVLRASAGILFCSTAISGAATISNIINYAALANYRAGVLDNMYVAHAFQLNSFNSLETAPTLMSNVLVDSSIGSWKSVVHRSTISQLSNWASTNVGPLTNSAFFLSRVLQLVEVDGPAFNDGDGSHSPIENILIG